MTDDATSDAPGLDGITFLDHTADVGIDVVGRSLELLFHRAAVGMLALLQGLDDDEDADGASSRSSGPEAAGLEAARGVEVLSIELEADTATELLADWLRELLFLHETRHADYARATFDRLTETVLEARVQTEPAAPAVREIKGVTYHELGVERTEDGWKGRVIFDV
ncbi:MAG: archease [Longimicrobiales bacterium]